MNLRILSGVFVCALSPCWWPSLAVSAEPSRLSTLLQEESEGKAVSRGNITGDVPSDEQTKWQMGFVKHQGEWLTPEELDDRLRSEAYEEKRKELLHNENRDLILARWCTRNQLPEQAKAHYGQVLMRSPNHADARKALGHVRVAGQWFDQEKLAEATERYRETMVSLEKWVPVLADILSDTRSGDTDKISQALTRLESMDVEESLPALELFASNVERDLVTPILRKITSLRSPEVCEALVRIALAHPDLNVQRIVSGELADYPEHYYVPTLLAMMKTESKVAARMVMQPDGKVGLETVVVNELQDRKQLARVQKLFRVVAVFSSSHANEVQGSAKGNISYWSNYWSIPKATPKEYGGVESKLRLSGGGSASSTYVPREVLMVAARNMNEHGNQMRRAASMDNRLLLDKMNRVCSVLRKATGQEIGDDAADWWTWWREHNERYEGMKPTVYGYETERRAYQINSLTSQTNDYGAKVHDFGDMTIQYSCLVPGTLVQTSTGLKAIERIEVGDLVLSKDVESGELALKPVLLTTVRPPKQTIKIVTSEDTIHATGGHYWWVSGRGWCRSRDLQPGMVFHTATGTATIEKISLDDKPLPTHNLVVDGFNTYFVGEERILSYDNTVLTPTLRKVPGYDQLIASK